MWQQRQSMRIWYWFQVHADLRPLSSYSMHQYPHRSHCNYFSRSPSFRWNSFPEWPHIFFVSTIRQIIRLSPSTLTRTHKKRNSILHTLFLSPSVSRTHKLTASTQLKNSTVGATCSCVYMCECVCVCVWERESVWVCVNILDVQTFWNPNIKSDYTWELLNFGDFTMSAQCLKTRMASLTDCSPRDETQNDYWNENQNREWSMSLFKNFK